MQRKISLTTWLKTTRSEHFLKKKLYAAGVSKIEIERASDRVKVIIYTAKPGVVIGKGGAEIEKIKAEVQKLTDKKLVVDIKEDKETGQGCTACC